MLTYESIDLRSTCLQCISACERCIQFSGDMLDAEQAQLAKDCASTCRMLLVCIASKSEHLTTATEWCANICEGCAEECARYQTDACQECADVCWTCAYVFRQTRVEERELV